MGLKEIVIFEKAKYLIDNNLISYHGTIKENDNLKMRFEVVGSEDTHQVTLEFKKLEGRVPIYQKIWSCTCKHSSMRGILQNVECSHSIACLVWVVLNSEHILKEVGV